MFIKLFTFTMSDNIPILTTNGYINATRMCYLKGLDYKDWEKENEQLIVTLEKTLGAAPCITLTNMGSVISGTYCHPLLIPQIALWMSPSFHAMFE
jgi:hypothetical protein